MNKNLFRNTALFFQWVGLILLIFVGVIFWAVYLIDGIISINFLLIYTAYAIYVLLVVIYSSFKSGFFKLESEENEELTKLKMNHSLTLSIPLIIFSIQLLSIDYLKGKSWPLFLIGLFFLIFSIIWLFKGYYLRFKKLKEKYSK